MKKSLVVVISAVMMLSVLPMMSVNAATEQQIEDAIEAGLVWLVAQQNTIAGDPNYGSWDGYGSLEAGTGLALYKLCDRAYELGYDSPFDSDYEYHENVSAGFNWTFAHLVVVDISPQDHTTGATGTMDDPDFNVNGVGVCAQHGTIRETYATGILLAAISASGTPTRVVNVLGSPVNGWTYGQVAQDMVDFLAFSQVEHPVPNIVKEGGWDYNAVDNGTGGTSWKGDQSNSGYAVLGLGEAQDFGCTVLGWVKTELSVWIDYVQDDVDGDTNGWGGSSNDGGSWYSFPGDGIKVNILKTGNLIFEMKLVGDTPTTQRVTNATNYLVAHWNDPSGIDQPPGWNGTPAAQYQAMFCAMKGLEYMGIDTFDGIDWFEDFSDVIVAQQNKVPGPTNGSWQSSSGRGDPVIITEWALLTLEKVAPERVRYPTDDSYTDQRIPYRNYGTATTLWAYHKPYPIDRYMWLKFDLTGVSTVTTATLHLHPHSSYGSPRTCDRIFGAHFCSDDSWTETTITWSNQPGFNAAFEDTVTNPMRCTPVEFNVTSIVQSEIAAGEQYISFVVKSEENCYMDWLCAYSTDHPDQDLWPYLDIE